MSPRTLLERMAGSLRVAAYVVLVLGLVSVWSLRRVLAQAELSMARSGEKLARELGPLLIGQPQTMSLNGQRLVLASRQSTLTPHEVLERFAEHCADAHGAAPNHQEHCDDPSHDQGAKPRCDHHLHQREGGAACIAALRLIGSSHRDLSSRNRSRSRATGFGRRTLSTAW